MLANSYVSNVLSRAPVSRKAPPHVTTLSSLAQLSVEPFKKPFNEDYARRLRPRIEFDALSLMVQISPSDAAKRRTLTWNGMAAETVHVEKHCRLECRFRGPVHLLALFEEGARSDGATFVEGLPPSTLRNYRRKFLFLPAGHEYYDWQEPRSLARVVYFYFDPAVLPVSTDLEFSDTTFVPRLYFEDAGLWDHAIKLKALIDHPQPTDGRYGEALGVVLAHELLRLSQVAPHVECPVRGGLAAWKQRAVASYIEEHLEEQISLATLAKLVRLSPYHFCRSFKQSFGMPPHRFHIRRRIEQAKSLLATHAVSVTEVGMAIGFSETSSFTTAFRKATGLTPTGYQRSLTKHS